MSNSFEKKDLRIIKTTRSLTDALLLLLNKQSFKKLTINEICEESLLSRATFYVHFNSKYDLLKYWFKVIENRIPVNILDYSETEMMENINYFIFAHKRVIKNIIDDYDELTFDLLQNMTMSILNKIFVNKTESPVNTTLLRFFAGGMLCLLRSHVKNKFPSDVNIMNAELFDIFKSVVENGRKVS